MTGGTTGRRLRLPILPRGWWWLELVAAVTGYELYNVVQAQTAGSAAVASQHARDVLRLEQTLHLDPERWLNHLATVYSWLGVGSGYFYALAHAFVTGGVLVWLWRRGPDHYARLRTALVAASLVALAVYWLYPVAPPRLAEPGVVDTLVRHDILGAAHVHEGLVNLYAAMPSLHVAWAVWCAAAVTVASGSRWARLAWLYPVAMTFIIMCTANHFVLDAVAGAALMALALLAVRHVPKTAPRAVAPLSAAGVAAPAGRATRAPRPRASAGRRESPAAGCSQRR